VQEIALPVGSFGGIASAHTVLLAMVWPGGGEDAAVRAFHALASSG